MLKNWLVVLSLLVVLLPLAACKRKGGGEGAELVVVSYIGEAQTPYRKFLSDPFEKKHPGTTVRLVPSECEDVVAQIKAARGVSPYDVVTLGEPRRNLRGRGRLGRIDTARRSDQSFPGVSAIYFGLPRYRNPRDVQPYRAGL